MADQKKLDAWADKLLDTGKRNNLISFKDTKASTAEFIIPDCESIFSKCSIGRVFDIVAPKETEEAIEGKGEGTESANKTYMTRQEYKVKYASLVKNDKSVLIYSQAQKPLDSVKKIAKKAKERLDETGINVAHLAFGFLKWNEKEESEVYYYAPLLLVHVNVITGSILDPIQIEVCDDDVVVNPTFNYLLQSTRGIELPGFEDGEQLDTYFDKVKRVTDELKWEVIPQCKLGVFSFLKLNMYEDLKKNADLILANENVQAILGENKEEGFNSESAEEEHVVKNPLIDLHTVVEADSSQIAAIEMAKSGKSFVLQGPPGTGKSQTITNIIAECLYDGKKVLFVSEKQAALNVVYVIFNSIKSFGMKMT